MALSDKQTLHFHQVKNDVFQQKCKSRNDCNTLADISRLVYGEPVASSGSVTVHAGAIWLAEKMANTLFTDMEYKKNIQFSTSQMFGMIQK
ncbi:MAG: hypothetical protein Q8898_14955 [Bacillota bacterium]|nr:hypothetical protein [Bacillota bacterium]